MVWTHDMRTLVLMGLLAIALVRYARVGRW